MVSYIPKFLDHKDQLLVVTDFVTATLLCSNQTWHVQIKLGMFKSNLACSNQPWHVVQINLGMFTSTLACMASSFPWSIQLLYLQLILWRASPCVFWILDALLFHLDQLVRTAEEDYVMEPYSIIWTTQSTGQTSKLRDGKESGLGIENWGEMRTNWKIGDQMEIISQHTSSLRIHKYCSRKQGEPILKVTESGIK